MKITRLAVLLLVLALVVPMVAFAQAPAGTWVTGIQIQNQSDTQDAHISISFYWETAAAPAGAPSPVYVHTDTIPAGQSKTYYVPAAFPSLPDNFVGSAVVSSDVVVAAILNTANTAGGTSAADAKRIGSATGVLEPSTTVYAPYLRKNYYTRNSYIAVQNTSANAASVTVGYKSPAGADVTSSTQSVPAYSTYIFYQNANASLPDNFYGSAIVSSSAPLAVVVNNANGSGTGFESYNGFAAGATTIYMPKLTVNYYGYQSGFQVQNTGTAAAAMTVNYTFGGSTWTKTSDPIAPGAAWSVYLANSPLSGIPAGTAGAGSAIVTCAQPVVGIVIETQDAQGFSVATSAVNAGAGTDVVLFPKFDRTYYGYNGGIQVQNVGTAATTIQAVFSQSGRPDVTVTSGTVAPGSSVSWYGPNVTGLSENFSGSVVVTSLGGAPIAGIYTSRNDGLVGDSYSAYNGIQKGS